MSDTPIGRIARFLKEHQRFILTSHSRPDGDAIGSTLALGLALISSGKEVAIISSDPVPNDYRRLPGARQIRIVREAPEGSWDGAIILECNGVERTGIKGLESFFLINIDHHASSLNYAKLNWVDVSFGLSAKWCFELLMPWESLFKPMWPRTYMQP